MNHKTEDSMKKGENGLRKSNRASKETKRALVESLLGNSTDGQSESMMEGGAKDGKAKASVSSINEVDRVEVVKDLGFSSKMTSLVFLYIFLIMILVNVDHGAIPAGLSDIQAELGMDESEMGLIGSMVFFGLFLGSITASFIMHLFEHKTIIWLSLLINGSSLWLLTLKSNFYLMSFSRLITGFSQIFITIYVPVFVDAYSTPKQKSITLSWVMVMSPIGVVVGYAMTAYIILNNGLWEYPNGHYWYQSFRLQCYMNWGAAALVFLIPSKYVNISECVKLKRAFLENKKSQKAAGVSTTLQVQRAAVNNQYGIDSVIKSNNHESQASSPAKVVDFEDSEAVESPSRSPMRSPKAQQENVSQEQPDKTNLQQLLHNKPYICLTLAISNLLFLISGVQYWATHYFEHVLGVEPKQASITFGCVALTSPVAGAAISGYIIHCFGGFQAPVVLPFCLMIGVFGIGSAWLVPLTSDILMTTILMWVLLFVGGVVLPVCTGVLLTKIEPEMRPRANSVSNVCYMLLGYFPAPAVYGFAVNLHGKADSNWGMGSLMYSITIMPILVFFACWFDPKLTIKNMFHTIKHNDIGVDNLESEKESAMEEESNAGAQELQQSGRLSLNIGLGVADTFAKNDILESKSQKMISHQDNTEDFQSFDHADLSARLNDSSFQRGRLSSHDGYRSFAPLQASKREGSNSSRGQSDHQSKVTGYKIQRENSFIIQQ